MRVLQTISGMSATSGGPSTCTRDLLDGLDAIHPGAVDLLTFKSINDDNLGKGSRWLIEITDDSRTPLHISSNFKQAITQSSYDLYHCNALWVYCNHLTCRYARQAGKPYILSPHGMLYPTALNIKRWKKWPMLKLWFNRDIQKASCIHATCKEEMEHVRTFGYKGPIAVIPNPVVIPDEVKLKNRIFSEPSIGFLGRFHPIKKIENLIQGARIALNRGCPNFRVDLIGGGSDKYENFIREEVRRLKLEDNVRFLGYLNGSEKYERLSQLRALFVPSLQENFGMIVPEALICGTPVYASIGTPWQELNECKCGWWRDNSPETIADIIVNVMSMDDNDLQAMGERGRRLIESNYEQHSVAAKMLDLYQWILGNGNKPEFVYD